MHKKPVIPLQSIPQAGQLRTLADSPHPCYYLRWGFFGEKERLATHQQAALGTKGYSYQKSS